MRNAIIAAIIAAVVAAGSAGALPTAPFTSHQQDRQIVRLRNDLNFTRWQLKVLQIDNEFQWNYFTCELSKVRGYHSTERLPRSEACSYDVGVPPSTPVPHPLP